MTSAFLTNVEDIATAVEKDVVSAAKTTLNYIDNVFVTEVDPALLSAWQLIERNGGQLLMAEAVTLLNNIGPILSGQWGTVVTQLIVAAKVAGATTLTQEEALAASTALQIAQAAQAVQTPVTP